MSLLFQTDTAPERDFPVVLSAPPGIPRGLEITKVFNTFWKFAVKRQEVFFRRLAGQQPPWSEDEILLKNKFTNVYRASDRVSQYLIKNIAYASQDPTPGLFFKIVLFKLFNKIETWELLRRELGEVSWENYSFARYDAILSRAIDNGVRIYSAAYIMPSGGKGARKHTFHLQLLERMMKDVVPKRLQDCRTMKDGFKLLRSYPSIGDFLAYQLLTDLNYSELLDFSEMDFVMPGPGAKDGMRKCFVGEACISAEAIIRWMTDTQEEQFTRLGLQFRNLWGRRIQLIDCQNLFCEVDKYSRNAHPEFTGISGRSRIKQRLRTSPVPIEFFYPPKWGINERLRAYGAQWGQTASAA
jgi:alpha-glutamyl/putrescinyl thymine pyrophosphorylase clade 1